MTNKYAGEDAVSMAIMSKISETLQTAANNDLNPTIILGSLAHSCAVSHITTLMLNKGEKDARNTEKYVYELFAEPIINDVMERYASAVKEAYKDD